MIYKVSSYIQIALLLVILGCKQSTNCQTSNNVRPIKKEVGNNFDSITQDLFASLLKRSKVENKRIFLVFSFRGCAWCKVFENYHNDPAVSRILSKHFIVKKIDINETQGGQNLCKTYGKLGFPSWTIIDSNKNVIMDSDKDGNGNIGYPDRENEIDYYINALRKADPSLVELEETLLKQKLREYTPKKSV